MSLPGPYEFWDMADGETRKLHILRFEEGTTTITPRGPDASGSKEIKVLRLYIRPEDKPTLPPYWDITSQHLIAHLKAQLLQQNFRNQVYTITKIGVAPHARFTVTIEPSS